MNSCAKEEPLLKCCYEEADDRMMFHLSHGVKVYKFESIVMCSTDADVYVRAAYHYSSLSSFGLNDFWLVTGNKSTRKCIPLHMITQVLNSRTIKNLPAAYGLSGSDSTSKVSTKAAVLKALLEHGHLLDAFGLDELSEGMSQNAEEFLVKCILSSSGCTNFNDLRYEMYHHKKFKFDLHKFPCTSESLKNHIRRACFETHLWMHSSIFERVSLSPTDYGYEIDESEQLIPIIMTASNLPDDFPSPCNCVKCAKKNVCPCRVRKIKCCQFCKCQSSQVCQNPNNL